MVVYLLPLVAALLAVLTVLLALRRRGAPGSTALAVSAAALVVWIVGQILEQRFSLWPQDKFWVQIQYLGIALAPVAWLLFVLSYVGYESFVTRGRLVLAALIPLLTTVAVWTNELHGLFWRLPVGFAGFGPWFWVHTFTSYLALLAGTLLLLRHAIATGGIHRNQAAVTAGSALLPWLVNVAYLFEIVPFQLDPTPVALSGGTFLLAWSLLRFRLLELVPVARESIVESLLDAVLVVDTYGRIADLNEAGRRLFACPTTPLGQPAESILACWPEALQLLRTEEPQTVVSVVAKGRSFELRATTIRRRRGQDAGRLLTWHDITERVVVEERERTLAQLAQRQARNLALIDQVRIAIAEAVSTQTLFPTVVEWIAGSFDYPLVGLYTSEAETLTLQHAIGYQTAPPLHAALERLLGPVARTGQPVLVTGADRDSELALIAPDATAIAAVPLLAHYDVVGVLLVASRSARTLDDDDLRLLVILGQSISSAIERARAAEVLADAHVELERRFAELDAFAHTVAHNIKTPLGAMISLCYLLDLDADSGPTAETREYLALLTASSLKISEIVDALLLLASINHTRGVPQEPLDMASVVRDVARRLQSLTEQHTAQLVVPEAWPVALGYAPWVEEIWVNYVSNAITYGGPTPTVTIGADPPSNGSIRFWVRDQGPGLSAAQQEKLFTPFTRLHLDQAPGHGLGLSIVQRIVSRLGGVVSVESAPGAGSTFAFTLPMAPDEPELGSTHKHGDSADPSKPANQQRLGDVLSSRFPGV